MVLRSLKNSLHDHQLAFSFHSDHLISISAEQLHFCSNH